MRKFQNSQSTENTEYDELLVWRLTEKIPVCDERLEVRRSGPRVRQG